MRKPEEYEAEIEALKTELERLRGGAAMMTIAGAQSVSGLGDSFTIQGLDEMILVIDEKGAIAYVNDRMAHLLGIPPNSRRGVLGSQLSDWSRGPLGDVLVSLLSAVKESGKNYVIDREFPDLEEGRLSSTDNAKVSDPPLIRFICTPVKEKVQIIAQDITHNNWLEKNFSRYVSPRVMEQMRELSEDELLATKRRVATMLFADLRGFTLACQELDPEQVVELINSFLEPAVHAVERFDGMVDKFVGDEIMAVFGAPISMPDHALRALMAADYMIKDHEKWVRDREEQGLIAPGIGIGIASGEVVIGNIGTKTRLDYTVLGHNVNLAARLCSKAAAGEILTVRSTHNMAKEGMNYFKGPEPVPRFHFDKHGAIELKNILKPVEIISVRSS